MKRIFVVGVLIAALTYTGNAQLGGLLNKVKNKAKNRADQKVDKEIDKTLDQIEGKKTADQPADNNNATVEVKAEEPSLKSFSKYDFIPGDSMLYYDNFEGEAIAELPTAWNTSGTGEVATLDKYPGNWLRLHKPFIYLSSNQKKFGENYTVEFDVIFQLKNTGWMYPELRFGLFATKDEPNGGNNFLNEYRKNAAVVATIYPAEYKGSKARLNSYFENKAWFNGDPKAYELLETKYGKPVHIAIQVQKERFRMWIDEEKLFDVPKFAIQLAKHLGATVATTTSAANIDLVKSLGADIIIDYKKDDFETILKDYDVVLNSQDTKTLGKSLKVVKAGGKVISISGPPDPDFGRKINANWFLKIVLKFLSAGIRKKAKRLGVNFSFLFMRAQGEQLSQITKLIESGVIRPVMDKVFPFEQANEAMTYIETGRAKGKVVVRVR